MSPPSPLFISLKFSVSGSLPTSSNRLSRQAHCSVYPPLSNSVPRSSRFSGGSTTSLICKPKSAIEERNKAPAYFQIATLRLSFLFVYITNRITALLHFISASHTPPSECRLLVRIGGPHYAYNTLNH